MILRFFEFINENFVDTDPIPELKETQNLGVILLGVPGAGKSTFAKKYIPRDMKKFSTDDVSLEFTGDPSKYYPKASEINLERLHKHIETDQDFIYDTTGISERNINKVYQDAKSNGYKVIFILVLIDLPTAKMQNIRRGRMGGHMAEEEFIEEVYGKQLETTKKYLTLNPDGFYLALSKSFHTPLHEFPNIKYQFMKFDKSGKLMYRRRNRYEYR